MPRIRDSRSDPYDFCWECFPDELPAIQVYATRGDGPDNRGNCFAYDDHHPPYEDNGYKYSKCCFCSVTLSGEDEHGGGPDIPMPVVEAYAAALVRAAEAEKMCGWLRRAITNAGLVLKESDAEEWAVHQVFDSAMTDQLGKQLEEMGGRLADFEKRYKELQSTKDEMVRRNRLLRERPDLPAGVIAERVGIAEESNKMKKSIEVAIKQIEKGRVTAMTSGQYAKILLDSVIGVLRGSLPKETKK